MSDLVVIVPSRGRPHTVAEMGAAFAATCTADTYLVFVVDQDDPTANQYPVYPQPYNLPPARNRVVIQPSDSMVSALNLQVTAETSADPTPLAIAFLGDDHRPRTVGWDRAYLDALAAKPGIVYGNDLFQGERLPTQCAMSTEIVRALGHMAPPTLKHLAVDNWWLELGRAADCITYLPDVIIEHLHPVAGKADWDDGYRRVNAPEMYQRDLTELARLRSEELPGAVAAVKEALGVLR